MPYRQVKPQKGSEIVMQHLKQQIESGEYPPGTRLPTVVELAEGFEVGRSTVREALSALKAMGFVDIRHGGGTFVSKELPREAPGEGAVAGLFYKAESLREVLEVRKFIETGCASLAALRRTDEDLRRLAETIEEMKQALSDEAIGEKADVRFHLQIAHASHNSLLVHMMESLTERLQDSMKVSRRLWFYSERATAERLFQEHTEIFDAIRKRDDRLAGETMMNHLRKVESVVLSAPEK
jgi:GntR family transcriptional repressor for pyruvate dehydrogenase complex